jgi:hypothetical protein
LHVRFSRYASAKCLSKSRGWVATPSNRFLGSVEL